MEIDALAELGDYWKNSPPLAACIRSIFGIGVSTNGDDATPGGQVVAPDMSPEAFKMLERALASEAQRFGKAR